MVPEYWDYTTMTFRDHGGSFELSAMLLVPNMLKSWNPSSRWLVQPKDRFPASLAVYVLLGFNIVNFH
jgi:hypothetical protein